MHTYVCTCISIHKYVSVNFLVDSGSGSPDFRGFCTASLSILAFLHPPERVGGRQVWRASYRYGGHRRLPPAEIYIIITYSQHTTHTHKQRQVTRFSTILRAKLKFICKPNKA